MVAGYGSAIGQEEGGEGFSRKDILIRRSKMGQKKQITEEGPRDPDWTAARPKGIRPESKKERGSGVLVLDRQTNKPRPV